MVSTQPQIDPGIAAAIGRHARIAAAWVVGSVARGDARRDSDLDVAVLLRGREGPGDVMTLYDLAGELERFAPSGQVDIVILGPQGSVFRHHVLSEGIRVVDADPEARRELEERTVIEYLDWKPTHDIAMRGALAGVAQRLAGGTR